MRKIILLFLLGTIVSFGQTGVVVTYPTYLDLSSTTSQGALLLKVTGYTNNTGKYRMYNGSNQYNCWDAATNQYISSNSYSAGPLIPGDATTADGTTWWVMFQRGTNNSTTVSFRSRLDPYSSNYQTFTVSGPASMGASFSLTGTVSAGGSYTLSQKYVVLGFDALTGGNLLCTSSTDLTTGNFTLACKTGTSIMRIEFRTVVDELAASVTNASGWTSAAAIGDVPLPVELTSFTAKVNGKNVSLNWRTATETNNYGFEVERSVDKIKFEKIGFIQGSGTSNSVREYSYTDNFNVKNTAYYRLKQVDNDGTFSYSDIVEVTAAPEEYALLQNYPNPFNPETNISFSLPAASFVKLIVYNAIGEEVAQLENGTIEKGRHTYSFNGKAFNSGVYFYKLTANNYTSVKKMVLIK